MTERGGGSEGGGRWKGSIGEPEEREGKKGWKTAE